ncbi:MAG: VWA domain-containing protein [Vicinamibacteria bacterium]
MPLGAYLALGLALVQTTSPAKPVNQPPIFAANTDLVLVDFVVTGDGDRAVPGLLQKDFTVTEDGQARPIVSFTAFGGVVPVDASPVPGAAAVSAARLSGAITVLFVDDGQLTIPQALRLRAPLKQLITTLADRGGALALIAPSSKVSLAKDLEGSRVEFSAAVDRITGHKNNTLDKLPVTEAEAFSVERGDSAAMTRIVERIVSLNSDTTNQLDPDVAEMMARGRIKELIHDARNRRNESYGGIARSLEWLGRQPGRHSLVMVSGGYARDPEDQRQKDIVTLSLRANAPIHFIDARGLQGADTLNGVEQGTLIPSTAAEAPFETSDSAEGATSLASDTGGISIRNVNDLTQGLLRLFDTMQTYYVIGYEPLRNKKPGFRTIKVQVQGKGLHVLARRGYFDEALASR